jgi:hypothetical protein
MTYKNEPRLEVYIDRSILVELGGDEITFMEGAPSQSAKARLEKIKAELTAGFLRNVIRQCADPSHIIHEIDPAHKKALQDLVSSVTSEVGRAIIGLAVLQLCVKAIAPEQSIRLHKAGAGGRNFSWCEGVPMRVLDKNFITPVLRETGLLNLNADGFMMTRSLAENYPYSNLYKAAIRGARAEWLALVDAIENKKLRPFEALSTLILALINRSDKFKKDASICMTNLRSAVQEINVVSDAKRFLVEFVSAAPYSARLFEVAMHSLFQSLEDRAVFDGPLKSLSQMRSANKKHGNIGDIEILSRHGGMDILESWDAKFGKLDLRDELEELSDKLKDHSETEISGFVVDQEPILTQDFLSRVEELEEIHGVSILVMTFDEWIDKQLSRAGVNEVEVCRDWIVAFGESLCQLRRSRAPIDEPCDAWVHSLSNYSAIFNNT